MPVHGKIVPSHVVPKLERQKHLRVTVVKVEAVADAAGTQPGATACGAATKACKVLPGEYPKITIKIDDPTTGALWKLTDAPFSSDFAAGATAATTARVRARVAYSTQNYANPGASTATQATFSRVPRGNEASRWHLHICASTDEHGWHLLGRSPRSPYRLTTRPLRPVDQAASLQKVAPVMNIARPDKPVENAVIASSELPMRSISPSAITAGSRGATCVDTANCLRCHKSLELHGSARANNVQLCIMCHNPAQAPRVSYLDANGTSTPTYSEPVDFKFFIHGLHSDNYKLALSTSPMSASPAC
jgi:OmcA/MtrC family decaheme c-type cytochrome